MGNYYITVGCLLFFLAGPVSSSRHASADFFNLSLDVIKTSHYKLLSSWPKSLKNDVCGSVIDDAIGMLNDSISLMEVNSGGKVLDAPKIEDLKTWLSTTITDQETCLDALQELNCTVPVDLKTLFKKSREYTSNSLALVTKTMGIHSKQLLGVSGFPYWVGAGDRKLLQEGNPRPDVTVALDGSGDFKSITEALGKVPKKSTRRFVIYVKKGEYLENVILDKSLWNVMVYGDGTGKTIVSGSLNFVDGTPTYFTATFAVAGKGFIAKDITFRNTAGAEKYQAVAFRSSSDQSVFYKCSFEGFQNTLYIHSNRQFYMECNITGTTDFIFGNAAGVFESCNIVVLRQPLSSQILTITAQDKTDPNQNTGISIQKSTIYPSDDPSAPSFLGRPCKKYSTTVIMETHIGSFLDPKGWIECTSSVIPPSTIFYAEYQNTGPGARVDKRVTWPGYKGNITADQANKFTVEFFV
ncbi:hypothetical protein LguiB_028426 [Lonicera macranthoides]